MDRSWWRHTTSEWGLQGRCFAVDLLLLLLLVLQGVSATDDCLLLDNGTLATGTWVFEGCQIESKTLTIASGTDITLRNVNWVGGWIVLGDSNMRVVVEDSNFTEMTGLVLCFAGEGEVSNVVLTARNISVRSTLSALSIISDDVQDATISLERVDIDIGVEGSSINRGAAALVLPNASWTHIRRVSLTATESVIVARGQQSTAAMGLARWRDGPLRVLLESVHIFAADSEIRAIGSSVTASMGFAARGSGHVNVTTVNATINALRSTVSANGSWSASSLGIVVYCLQAWCSSIANAVDVLIISRSSEIVATGTSSQVVIQGVATFGYDNNAALSTTVANATFIACESSILSSEIAFDVAARRDTAGGRYLNHQPVSVTNWSVAITNSTVTTEYEAPHGDCLVALPQATHSSTTPSVIRDSVLNCSGLPTTDEIAPYMLFMMNVSDRDGAPAVLRGAIRGYGVELPSFPLLQNYAACVMPPQPERNDCDVLQYGGTFVGSYVFSDCDISGADAIIESDAHGTPLTLALQRIKWTGGSLRLAVNRDFHLLVADSVFEGLQGDALSVDFSHRGEAGTAAVVRNISVILRDVSVVASRGSVASLSGAVQASSVTDVFISIYRSSVECEALGAALNVSAADVVPTIITHVRIEVVDSSIRCSGRDQVSDVASAALMLSSSSDNSDTKIERLDILLRNSSIAAENGRAAAAAAVLATPQGDSTTADLSITDSSLHFSENSYANATGLTTAAAGGVSFRHDGTEGTASLSISNLSMTLRDSVALSSHHAASLTVHAELSATGHFSRVELAANRSNATAGAAAFALVSEATHEWMSAAALNVTTTNMLLVGVNVSATDDSDHVIRVGAILSRAADRPSLTLLLTAVRLCTTHFTTSGEALEFGAFGDEAETSADNFTLVVSGVRVMKSPSVVTSPACLRSLPELSRDDPRTTLVVRDSALSCSNLQTAQHSPASRSAAVFVSRIVHPEANSDVTFNVLPGAESSPNVGPGVALESCSLFTQLLTPSQSQSSSVSISSSPSNSASASSSHSDSASKSRSASQTSSSSVSLSVSRSSTWSPSVSVTTSATTSGSASSSATSTASTSTSVTVSHTWSTSTSSSITLTESLTSSTSLSISTSSSDSDSASASPSLSSSLSASQSATNSASLSRSYTLTTSLSVSGTTSHSPSLSSSGSLPLTVSATLSRSETITLSSSLSFSDSLTASASETISRSQIITLSSSLSLSDSLTASASATLSRSETIALSSSLSLSDSLTASASVYCSAAYVLVPEPATAFMFDMRAHLGGVMLLNVTITEDGSPIGSADPSKLQLGDSSRWNSFDRSIVMERLNSSWGVITDLTTHPPNRLTLRLVPPPSLPLDDLPIYQQTRVTMRFTYDNTPLFLCRGSVNTRLHGELSFRFTFLASDLPIPREARQQLEIVAVTSTAVSGVLTNPTTGMVQARSTALLAISLCRFSHTEPMEATESPTGWTVGAASGGYYRGALIGNATILVFCLCFAGLATLLFYDPRKPHRRMWGAMGILHLPSVLIVPISLLMQGTITAATALLGHGVGRWDFGLSVGAYAVVLAILAAVVHRTTVGFFAVIGPREEADDPRNNALQRVLYYMFLSDQKWLNDPERPEKSAGFKVHWQQLFNDYRAGRQWFLGVELLVSIVVGVLSGVKRADACQGIAATFLGLLGMQFGMAVLLRPFVAPFETFFHIVLSGLTLSASVLLVIGEAQSNANWQLLGTYLSLGAVFLSIFKSVVDAVSLFRWFHSRYRRRRLRRQEKRDIEIQSQREEWRRASEEALRRASQSPTAFAVEAPMKQEELSDEEEEDNEERGEGRVVASLFNLADRFGEVMCVVRIRVRECLRRCSKRDLSTTNELEQERGNAPHQMLLQPLIEYDKEELDVMGMHRSEVEEEDRPVPDESVVTAAPVGNKISDEGGRRRELAPSLPSPAPPHASSKERLSAPERQRVRSKAREVVVADLLATFAAETEASLAEARALSDAAAALNAELEAESPPAVNRTKMDFDDL